jgi:GxxExxY protein
LRAKKQEREEIMPIKADSNLVRMTQSEFASVAYEVVNEAFSVHQKLGPLFDEKVYRNAMKQRLKNMQTEVHINVSFQDFHKSFFMDALVSNGAVFEFKAVESFTDRHRNQLLNYLLLTELEHGKLINFKSKKVEHEFVNARLTQAARTCFSISDNDWMPTDGFGNDEKSLMTAMLKDWGIGLDHTLYEDFLFHLLGGEDKILKEIDVYQSGTCIARQTVSMCGKNTAVRLTTFQDNGRKFLQELNRFALATALKNIQWINIARNKVTFKTLHFASQTFPSKVGTLERFLTKKLRTEK